MFVCKDLLEIKRFPEKVLSLDLSGQKLDVFPWEILDCVNLIELNLARTQIPELPWSISDLKNLSVLHLSRCPIQQLPKSIQKLDLRLQRQ